MRITPTPQGYIWEFDAPPQNMGSAIRLLSEWVNTHDGHGTWLRRATGAAGDPYRLQFLCQVSGLDYLRKVDFAALAEIIRRLEVEYNDPIFI